MKYSFKDISNLIEDSNLVEDNDFFKSLDEEIETTFNPYDFAEGFNNEVERVRSELENIINNHPNEIDSVDLHYDVLGRYNRMVSLFFRGYFRGILYEYATVLPKFWWNNEKELIFTWIKAMFLHRYINKNGKL